MAGQRITNLYIKDWYTAGIFVAQAHTSIWLFIQVQGWQSRGMLILITWFGPYIYLPSE
jgi:hypothetical protein